MRLSEEQLKTGFVHPNRIVRGAVTDYFTESFTRDPDATRWAIRGVEQYGWQDVLAWPHKFCELPLLDDFAFEWVCQQVERTDSEAPNLNLRGHLTKMLAEADVTVLARQQSRLLAMDTVEARDRETIVRRMELSQADPEECWQALEEHCRRAAAAENFAEAQTPKAKLLLEPLIQARDRFIPRVLEVLRRPRPAPDLPHPDHWLIGLMIVLAGRLRLEEAAPLIWDCWEADWDWYNEEVMYALTRIGTPSVIQLARERYPKSEWYVRNYAHNLLEQIRGDDSIDAIEELIPGEEDEFLVGQLGIAAAAQYDERAAQLALRLWNEDSQDLERGPIRNHLVAFSHLSGWEFAERDEFEVAVNAEDLRMQKEIPELSEFMETLGRLLKSKPLLDAPPSRRDLLDDGLLTDQVRRIDAPRLNAPLLDNPLLLDRKVRVGRNDPCSCGSGKKFKKCCLKETATKK